MNHLIAALFSIQVIAVTVLLTTSISCYGDTNDQESAPLIEIFTSSQLPTNGSNFHRSSKGLRRAYTLYEIDGISQFQSELSEGLPKDPTQAKQLVLARFQSMDAAVNQQLENAGKGLARAMHYGVHRYPAIVFDGWAVVCGVTDIEEAITHYTQWRERSRQ